MSPPNAYRSVRPAENPFRVERLHSLDYEPQDTTWPALLARLERLHFRAAIIGPHGTGKTTCLRSLAPRLQRLGLRPRPLFRNADSGGRGWPDTWRPILAGVEADDVLLVDGYGHLGPVPRLRLRLLARRAAGVVVTSHARCDLPTLLETQTSAPLLQRVVHRLTHDPIDAEAARELFDRHRGNLREALWELYDRAAGCMAAGGL